MTFIVNQPLGQPIPFTQGGWTRPELIEMADRRTERRGSKVLNLDNEFILCLQEFCLEHRWSWRRKTTRLSIAPTVQSYDLSDPLNANAGDLYQFMQNGVHLYTPSGDKVEVTPLFEKDKQDLALDLPTLGQPAQYFMMPGSSLQLVLTPIPDNAYPMRLGYWSVPVFTPATQTDVIPLVPANLQHVLLKKLEAQIFRFTLGEGTSKYQAAKGEYDMLVEKYQSYQGFVPGESVFYTDRDSHDSIRSTT
jgi:hypothetical protein